MDETMRRAADYLQQQVGVLQGILYFRPNDEEVRSALATWRPRMETLLSVGGYIEILTVPSTRVELEKVLFLVGGDVREIDALEQLLQDTVESLRALRR